MLDMIVFTNLALDERASYAMRFGTFIRSVVEGDKCYSLYRTPKFYIRTIYDIKREAIIEAKSFKSNLPRNDIDIIKLFEGDGQRI